MNVLRDAMAVDSLDKCGIYFGTTGGQVYGSADAGDTWAPIVRDLPAVLSVEVQTLVMIRVILPAHLRTLANVDREIQVLVQGTVTISSILDAVESRYPMLCGTLRDHVTHKRRPLVRFFACEEDISHQSADLPLSEKVANGSEPFVIIGAIAGG